MDVSVAFLHLHRTLAHALLLVALGALALALSSRALDGGRARLLRRLVRYGTLMLGRVNLVVGMGLLVARGGPYAAVWPYVALVLWGPVEAAWGAWIRPEVEVVEAGGAASGRLVRGLVVQLVVVAAIYGLMSARPL